VTTQLVIKPVGDSDLYRRNLPACPDWTIYHTIEWLEFLDDIASGWRFDLAILRDGELVGLMPARRLKIGPIGILGSPMPGWSTPYMGPIWLQKVEPVEFWKAMLRFMKTSRIRHAELCSLDHAFGEQSPWRADIVHTYEAPILGDCEKMLSGFGKSCRKLIRRAQRNGVVTEFTEAPSFVETYYAFLLAVYGKRNLHPYHPLEHIQSLWNRLKPSGRMLTSWALFEGRPIAARIDFLSNGRMHSFGSSSDQNSLKLYPNEILRYFVMCHAAAEGLTVYDMTGGGSYKEKFGAVLVSRRRLMYSPAWVRVGRTLAKKYVYWRTRGRQG